MIVLSCILLISKFMNEFDNCIENNSENAFLFFFFGVGNLPNCFDHSTKCSVAYCTVCTHYCIADMSFFRGSADFRGLLFSIPLFFFPRIFTYERQPSYDTLIMFAFFSISFPSLIILNVMSHKHSSAQRHYSNVRYRIRTYSLCVHLIPHPRWLD